MTRYTLEESRSWCHELMRSAARNFYYGMSLLPEEKRQAMFALYAFMRRIDDIADSSVDAGTDKALASAALEYWRSATHRALAGEDSEHPMFPALREAVDRFGIPPELLDSAIDGQLMDMNRSHYESFDELNRYCYCVASTVGIAALYIWEFRGDGALALADDRGVAFQLTNILRDIREDHARGRVYLPQEDLVRFGVNLDSVLAGGPAEAFAEMMRFESERAAGFYASSAALEELIAPDSRATLRIMTSIYEGILKQIQADPLAVLSRRVGLSSSEKFREVGRELWRTQREGPS